jgi:hypothetical protein
MFYKIFQFFLNHPGTSVAAASAASFVFNNIVTVLVSELPAPTKDSTAKYIYWFKVLNTIVGNLKRAHSTAIEQSPNLKAAVDAHVQNLAESGLIDVSGRLVAPPKQL